jgi:hypothetical protein
LTASGKLLSYKNAQDAKVMTEAVKQGLAKWNSLPQAETKPGAVKVPDLKKPDPRYTRTLPKGGLILKCYTRILDRDGKHFLKRGSCKFAGGDRAARDHVWLTEPQWQGMVPTKPKKGDRGSIPDGVIEKLVRYHLVDNTRGEPPAWQKAEIRKSSLIYEVLEVTPKTVHFRLKGQALLASDKNPAMAKRGFDAQMVGDLVYDKGRKAITRFDLIAFGDHWGSTAYTGGARPGRQPLGVSFELADGRKPQDLVPPQAARDFEEYIGRAR